jgi:selenium metabolism protein YedF
MIQVNAMGDTCPIPVVKTKKAIKELNGAGIVETLVDNEIAVQNLIKMAKQKGYGVTSEKLAANRYKVTIKIGQRPEASLDQVREAHIATSGSGEKHTIVVITSSKMGEGSDELGAVLMKGFIYALSQQEPLPNTILFYNGGAALACEESPALADLKALASQGVEILVCGTCLNFYGLSEKLKVGEVTNMYTIAEKMMQADLIVKP